MGLDACLTIDGIKGGDQRKGVKDLIIVHKFWTEIERPGMKPGEKGKANLGYLWITRKIDKSLPDINYNCCACEKPISSVKLELFESGVDKAYMTYVLTGCYVAKTREYVIGEEEKNQIVYQDIAFSYEIINWIWGDGSNISKKWDVTATA